MTIHEDDHAMCRFCRYRDATGGIEDILFHEIKECLEEEKEKALSDFEKELCEEEAGKLAESIMLENLAMSMQEIWGKADQPDQHESSELN